MIKSVTKTLNANDWQRKNETEPSIDIGYTSCDSRALNQHSTPYKHTLLGGQRRAGKLLISSIQTLDDSTISFTVWMMRD